MSDQQEGAGAVVQMPEAKKWRFSQWFRKMQNTPQQAPPNGPEAGEELDALTAVEFDDSGRFLATGDRSGNIVILERDTSEKKKSIHFSFFSEFISHYPDFDFVRSQQVDERINQIKFGRLNGSDSSVTMLTTNDRQIKLWKVKDTEHFRLVNFNIEQPINQVANVNSAFSGLGRHFSSRSSFGSPNDANIRAQVLKSFKNLKIPKKIVTENGRLPHLKKQYAPDVHQYGITSLAMAPDKENFISGDNLRVNLWDLHVADHSYNVLDIKPDNIDQLNEIITSIDYHPTNSFEFLYTTSLGNIMVCDLRQKANVDEPRQVLSLKSPSRRHLNAGATVAQVVEGNANNANPVPPAASVLNEMTQSISSGKFSKGGKFIISRDYLSVKIWDVAMDKKPFETIYVHEYLRERLWELDSNDLLWDPFSLGISGSGDIVTGSYSNMFHIIDNTEKKSTFVKASESFMKSAPLSALSKPKDDLNRSIAGENPLKKKKSRFLGGFLSRNKKTSTKGGPLAPTKEEYPFNLDFNTIDFKKKILYCAWHPDQPVVAVAGQNNLFLYLKDKEVPRANSNNV